MNLQRSFMVASVLSLAADAIRDQEVALELGWKVFAGKDFHAAGGPVRALVDDRRLVVLGRVLGTDSLAEIVVVVEEQFKGARADTLRLRRTDSSCEYFEKVPSLGARYALLIGTHNGPMTVGECSGSGRLEEREAELGWLRSRRRAV